MKFGSRWDRSLRDKGNGTEEEIGWSEFHQIQRLIEGSSSISISVYRKELPVPEAPVRPFWYSATITSEPMLIRTAKEAAEALETLNLRSWSFVPLKQAPSGKEPVRAWLVSPLHPMARFCRWSLSNYLLATPASVTLFLDHIASLGRSPILMLPDEPLQNRFRLSRMKVTGP
jgi:hypothetical protein